MLVEMLNVNKEDIFRFLDLGVLLGLGVIFVVVLIACIGRVTGFFRGGGRLIVFGFLGVGIGSWVLCG